MTDTWNPADARSVSELTAATGRPKYVHFWGHRPPASGGVSASCLSQWWPADFTVDGTAYATAEHYMMAGKARLFDDAETAERIVAAGHPGEAKKLGRQVRGFDQATWEEARFGIVVDGNVAKFGQNPDLRSFLLGTGDRVLVEASPRDRVWGIGLSARNENAERPEHWRGLNLLGFALMEARARLASGEGD
ncbi:NADAR family protein [Nocardiopsis sp. FIRDI 009]|uniref:NADAR family protein n=1 Tax=Nocardiopsis sp. FIRDI 009 TaxID=714197 RepID=UPI000E27F2FD|nr:NADAR family protein [Nocardiopsis sp. FIRDI 009]